MLALQSEAVKKHVISIIITIIIIIINHNYAIDYEEGGDDPHCN